MSNSRHVDPLVRGAAGTHPPGAVLLPVGPEWGQLIYGASGAMTVSTPGGDWVIPPHRALWVPDGAPATIVTRGRVRVRILYLSARLGRRLHAMPSEPRAVNVTPLLRELILHAVQACPLDVDDPADSALLTVVLDQLRALEAVPLQLPMPADPEARRVAEAIKADPAEARPARRTIERRFVAETGMTLGAWRRRARMLRALELLAGGHTVTATAMAVGFSTPSAFVASFKAELGATPSAYGLSARRPP